MITAVEEELHAAGVARRAGVVLADAGYWTNNAIEALSPKASRPRRARRRPPQRTAARAARRAL